MEKMEKVNEKMTGAEREIQGKRQREFLRREIPVRDKQDFRRESYGDRQAVRRGQRSGQKGEDLNEKNN